ncbi:glycosyltransferase family 2 protein [Nonlabens xiamenensis]|uniref:glycosyltransferase family 2 protein n=1 Tax=Nonlabens xiamenensis TaxID=2341043 RepID=UPI000F607E08|nr:glycosyltransferase family 2 protein [Nonlabens xiamenensis]
MNLVSVILPSYNSRGTIQAALDSIVAQTHRPIQVITIDDCSQDDSYAFAKAYSNKFQEKELEFIPLKNDTNMGAGSTRNKGIERATGKYIAFLDADDLWKPHKLTLQLKAMEKHQADFCYGAYEIFSQDPDRPKEVHLVREKLTFPQLLRANYIGHLTGIYKASSIGKVEMPLLRKRQDWAMWLDVMKKAGFAIGVQEPIASYRQGNGLSSNKWALIPYNYAVYRHHLGYHWFKSTLFMLVFFYEQFFVKGRFKQKIDDQN